MKKLETLEFTRTDTGFFWIERHMFDDSDKSDSSSTESGVINSFRNNILGPGNYVQFMCDINSDAWIIQLSLIQLRDCPDAQKMLWHYLIGKGEELEVDTGRVMREDKELRRFVYHQISIGLASRKDKGSVNVQQSNYSIENWKNAFGCINMKWSRIADHLVEMWIEDIYDWHPGEARVTQCVHAVMARAKKYGAMAFKYHGTKMTAKVIKDRLE